MSLESDSTAMKYPSDYGSFPGEAVASTSTSEPHSSEYNQNHSIGSFKKRLGYLLTGRERSQLKKALQIYAERK